MRNRLLSFVLAAALAAAFALLPRAAAQEPAVQPPPPPRTHLKVGDPAPEFTLRDHTLQPVALSSFRGEKNVVLAFYVFAFTGG